jgi:UDP-glucose-4-epimerase GalE
MNILVTGGAGYIGSHTCKALAKEGYLPVAYDNLSTGHEWAVQWGPLIRGDLSDAGLLRHTLAQYGVSAVVHFAASSYVGESVHDPRKYYRNNLVNSLGLLDAMLDSGVSMIICSSTCATYGEPQMDLLDEAHPQQPVNPYGETKLAFERALAWYGNAYALRSVVLRYFNAAGADPDAEIGELHDPETHLIPLVIEAALDSRCRVPILGSDYPTPDGTAIRDYVHVSDLADAHVRALRLLAAGRATASFNLGVGRGYSVREVVHAVECITGRTVRTIDGPRRCGDPHCLVANADLAQAELGWTSKSSDLDHIVRTAWRWRRKLQHGWPAVTAA